MINPQLDNSLFEETQQEKSEIKSKTKFLTEIAKACVRNKISVFQNFTKKIKEKADFSHKFNVFFYVFGNLEKDNEENNNSAETKNNQNKKIENPFFIFSTIKMEMYDELVKINIVSLNSLPEISVSFFDFINIGSARGVYNNILPEETFFKLFKKIMELSSLKNRNPFYLFEEQKFFEKICINLNTKNTFFFLGFKLPLNCLTMDFIYNEEEEIYCSFFEFNAFSSKENRIFALLNNEKISCILRFEGKFKKIKENFYLDFFLNLISIFLGNSYPKLNEYFKKNKTKLGIIFGYLPENFFGGASIRFEFDKFNFNINMKNIKNNNSSENKFLLEIFITFSYRSNDLSPYVKDFLWRNNRK